VNRDIQFAGQKRSFDLRREQPFPTSIELDNFGVVASCDDDFRLDRDVRMRVSNCLFNQQSLCAGKVAAARAEGDLGNHRGNVTRDTLQGKLSACSTTPKRGVDFRLGRTAQASATHDSILVRSSR